MSRRVNVLCCISAVLLVIAFCLVKTNLYYSVGCAWVAGVVFLGMLSEVEKDETED